MPEYANLNTEHIKSHLQKYRIRSKEEFMAFYHAHLRDSFQEFEVLYSFIHFHSLYFAHFLLL